MQELVGFLVLIFLCVVATIVLLGMPIAFSRGMRLECTHGKFYNYERCITSH